MGLAGFYQQEKDVITHTMARAEAVRAELETAYSRWEELERGG